MGNTGAGKGFDGGNHSEPSPEIKESAHWLTQRLGLYGLRSVSRSQDDQTSNRREVRCCLLLL